MESHQIVYIRTDANQEIATGHVMRCLTIAREVTRLAGRVTFVVSDEESKGALRGRFEAEEEYPVICMGIDYRHLEKELLPLLSLLESESVTCLLVDSYYVTETYLKTVQCKVKTAYIDDLGLFDYPVDIILNYDVGVHEKSDISVRYQRAGIRLLGEKYAPLRRQFQKVSYVVRKDGTNLFLATGGTDTYHMTMGIIETLSGIPGAKAINFHVVAGSMNQDRKRLRELSQHNRHVILYENIEQMAEVMVRCDVAVSAAGTTLFELCAVGVPAVSFSMADNQILCAKAFGQAGYIEYIGDVRENREELLEKLAKAVLNLLTDWKQRQVLSERMKEAITGNGALEIARTLVE